MSPAAPCALATAAAVLAWPAPPGPVRRLQLLRPPARAAPPGPVTRPVRPVLAVAAALVAGAVLVTGVPTWLAAAGVAIAVTAVRRRQRPAVLPELPLALDLLASCLAAGATWPDAVAAAAAAAGPDLAGRLTAVRTALADGSTPEQAWGLVEGHPELSAVARCCRRAGGSGSAAGGELGRLAQRLRLQRRAASQQRAARASIWVVLPLGLCFLPAFVLVGVVPLALGLLRGVL